MSNKSPQKPPPKASGKTVTCNVYLLDGENKEFSIDKNDVGRALFDTVCTHLDLIERDYFGLTYTDDRGPTHLKYWLNLDKKISKQKKRGAWVFEFALKFYPPDPTHLRESLTRWLVVLQIRRDLLSGRLPCTFTTYALLGSYNVQADIGEFDPNDHGHSWDYIKDMSFAPNQTPDLLEKIAELHKQHKGQTPDEAEKGFLDNAKKLAMYGVDLHKAKDSENNAIMIGVCCSGILIYQDKLRINRFVWPKILKLSYKRNHFYIKIRPGEMERNEATIMFKLDNHRLAKRLWKTCVEHHAFFRLREAEKPANNVSFPRFGSKFRYSGRTLYQTRQNAALLDRPPPFFERSQPARNTMHDTGNRSQSMDELGKHSRDGFDGETFFAPYKRSSNDMESKKMWGDDRLDKKSVPIAYAQATRNPDGRAISSDAIQKKPHDSPDKRDALNKDFEGIPLFDGSGKPLYEKPVYSDSGETIFDDQGKPINPIDADRNYGKPIQNEDGTPLYNKNGKPLYYKDGHRAFGKPLYDDLGKPICDRDGKPLYGKPVFGVPMYGNDGRPICDADGNPLFVRPVDGQPVCDKEGRPLFDKKGKPLYHQEANPFFNTDGDQLHGQPVFDKDCQPIYNNDGKPVFDKEGKQFYDEDGKPVYDKTGKPLYNKPACDIDQKPLLGRDGKPLYGKDVKPLYWEGVYDKNGQPYFGKLFDHDGKLHPFGVPKVKKAKDTPDRDAIPLYDNGGKNVYYKPVYQSIDKPLYDSKGKPLYPSDAKENGKPLLGDDGKQLLGKDGRPLFYKDGLNAFGKPLFDADGKPICDRDGKQLYGKPVYGVPMFDIEGRPITDTDGNPLYARPAEGEAVCDKDGRPLLGNNGKPLLHKDAKPFYDRGGHQLHGKPLYDKDGLPLYDDDGRPVYDKDGNLFFDEDGRPVHDVNGKPLYSRPACDHFGKPIQDKNGKPMFGKDVRPLYWEEVYDKDGKPFFGKLYDKNGQLHPYGLENAKKDTDGFDKDGVPLYDANGKPLFDKPVYLQVGKPLFDDRGKPLYPKEVQGNSKALLDDSGKPLVDKKGKPLFYKEGHQVLGKQLFDNQGKPLCDLEGKPLYGRPVYGIPLFEKDGKPALDSDGNPLYSRPEENQSVCDKDGRQLFDKQGKPLTHQDATPFYDREGNHLHGKPLYDKDGLPLYNKDGKPVYDKDGKPFYDSDGKPIHDKSGKPLYSKPAFDPFGKPLKNSDGKPLYGKDVRPIYWEDIYDKDGKPFFDIVYSKDGKPHPQFIERTGPKKVKGKDYKEDIPLYDTNGKPLFDKPVFIQEGKPIFDEKGKLLHPKEIQGTAKPLEDEKGKPLLDKKGKPLFYKDGQQVFGKPLYDEYGKPMCEMNGKQLYGKPIYGIPLKEKDGKIIQDSDGSPIMVRPLDGQPICSKDGKQLLDSGGNPLFHETATPLYDENGNHLHGKPLYDKDGLPLYNRDGKPVYDREGKPFFNTDGKPVLDKSGKPTYSKPAFDDNGKSLQNNEGKALHGKDFRPVYWEEIFNEDGKPFFGKVYSQDGKPHAYAIERVFIPDKAKKAHLVDSVSPFTIGFGVGKGDMTGVVGEEKEIDNKQRYMPIPKAIKATRESLKTGFGDFFNPAATSTVGRGKVPPPVPPKANHGLDDSFNPPTVATEKVKYNPNFSDVLMSSRNIPLVKTETRTVTYERNNFLPDLDDGILVSAQSHSTKLQTIETTTYKTERDGIEELRVVQKVVMSGDEDEDFDFDAALVDAIRSVTEFNPDMSVERIECVQQIEDVKNGK
ncbi:mesocentin-like isoform X2 [Physella acuta]|nr:mesocentin-like isoform X2 [Physella acuta]